MLVFDADGDGTNDLFMTKAGTGLPAGNPGYQPRLFLNDGNGSLRPAPTGTLPPLGLSVGAMAAAGIPCHRKAHCWRIVAGDLRT